MQRINLGFWYQLGAAVRPLLALRIDTPMFQVLTACVPARQWVEAALNARIVRLSTSHPSAIRLHDSLVSLLDSLDFSADPPPTTVAPDKIVPVAEAAREFDTIYLAELQQADAYVVSAKGTYATSGLIFTADDGFIGEAVQTGLPQAARIEIQQWGRCFAFELPTASGFHIMRATEIVILSFLERIAGRPVKVRPRTWNAYIKALEKAGASEAITSSLHQIRKLHRNPLMHPEDSLDLSKADALFGLAKAAIIAMITPETLSEGEEELGE
jgi:hypothetical protein